MYSSRDLNYLSTQHRHKHHNDESAGCICFTKNLFLTCLMKCTFTSEDEVINLLRLRVLQNRRPCFYDKQHWPQMLHSHWSISNNTHDIYVRFSKNYIFRKSDVFEKKKKNYARSGKIDSS